MSTHDHALPRMCIQYHRMTIRKSVRQAGNTHICQFIQCASSHTHHTHHMCKHKQTHTHHLCKHTHTHTHTHTRTHTHTHTHSHTHTYITSEPRKLSDACVSVRRR